MKLKYFQEREEKFMRYLPDGVWMQKADTHTIENIGIPSMVLMERAALKTVEIMEREQINLHNALLVCGSGNNGGDGFAIARLLMEKGYTPTVVFAGKEQSLSAQCRLQKEIIEKLGIVPCTEILPDEYTVVIDALFGVGLSREIQGHYAEIIEQMNQIQAEKVAVDIPSGIHAGNGRVMGTAFQAELTVTFACEKLGCVLYPGKNYAGKVIPAEIGICTEIFKEASSVCFAYERDDLYKNLPKRKADSHKGTYGKVLMIAGSKGMAGAAYLAAKAAYTAGAGLVQIYTAQENLTILQQLVPEAIIEVYREYDKEQLERLLEWADIVCIGCGIGQGKTASSILTETLKQVKVPCIIDADGLNLLSRHMELLKDGKGAWILTPHMKEMSRLTGRSIEEWKENRLEGLAAFTQKYPVVCALKDSRTVVSAEGKQLFVNTAGSSAMAKAGSGDVLAGTITGLTAQGLSPYEGCILGIYLHACGGEEAAKEKGEYSVLAEDLICGIQRCLKNAKERK